MMINLLFCFIVFYADKDKAIDLPFLKVDTISSNRVLINYNCIDKLIKSKGFIPVYWKDEYVGLGMVSSIDKNGWVYSKVYLIKKIDEEYYLRANYKVLDSKFNQDGCYWQINDCYITKFVFIKNGSRFD